MNFLLGVTAEALWANIDWKSAFSLQPDQLDPKFQGEGVAPTNHFSCPKTRINGLSCGIKISTQLSFVLSQITRLTDGQTDRRTDGRTTHSWLETPCIQCSAVKSCTWLFTIRRQASSSRTVYPTTMCISPSPTEQVYWVGKAFWQRCNNVCCGTELSKI